MTQNEFEQTLLAKVIKEVTEHERLDSRPLEKRYVTARETTEKKAS